MTRRHPQTAAFAVVLLLAGNVLAWLHESEVRHVTCAEHGEALHASEPPGVLATSEDSRSTAIDGQGSEHEDCSIARLLRTSTQTTSCSSASIAVVVVAATETSALVERIHAIDIVAIAPKTSPPT